MIDLLYFGGFTFVLGFLAGLAFEWTRAIRKAEEELQTLKDALDELKDEL